jgi:hypothetical protein
MVGLALWLLLASERFERPAPTLALGVVVGLGMLTKPSFAAYVGPAFLVALVAARGLRARGAGALALLIAAVVSVPWYGPRIFGLPAQVGARSFKQAAESGHPDPYTWAGLSFYPKWFATEFGVATLLLLLVGLAVALARRHGLLLVSLLVPLAAFMLLQNKNLRYTLPILPAAVALAGLGFAVLGRRARVVVAALVVAVAAVQVSATAFGRPRGLTIPATDLPLVIESPPAPAEWPHREILRLVAADSRGAAATVSIAPNHGAFSAANFRYFAVRDGLALQVTRAWDDEPIGVDYMVEKTGHVGPSWTAHKPARIAARLAGDPHLARAFPVLAEFALPDGSVATVRARRLDGVETPPAILAERVEAAVKRRLGEVARDVENLTVSVAHDPAIRQGRVTRLEIVAAAATVGELRRRDAALLRVRDLRIVVDDLLVNPYTLAADGRLDPLDAGRVRVEHAAVAAGDLQTFLHGLKAFRRASVALEPGTLELRLDQPGPDLEAHLRVLPAADRPFALLAERVRLGGVPVPGALVNWIIRHIDPSTRLAARLPVPVEVAPVTVDPDAVRIGTR